MSAEVKIINQRTFWSAQGTRPDDSQMDWVPRQRPPSDWFDWFFYSTYKDIEDLALFIQHFGVSRELGPAAFEMAGGNGAYIGAVGDNDLPVIVYEQGKRQQAHTASRVAVPDGVDTWVKIVWSTPGNVAGRNAYIEIRYKTTRKGEQRTGGVNSKVVIAPDSNLPYGQNETWVNLGSLPQGAMLDLWVVVDATQASHTVTSDVYVHQVILDPEPEEV